MKSERIPEGVIGGISEEVLERIPETILKDFGNFWIIFRKNSCCNSGSNLACYSWRRSDGNLEGLSEGVPVGIQKRTCREITGEIAGKGSQKKSLQVNMERNRKRTPGETVEGTSRGMPEIIH